MAGSDFAALLLPLLVVVAGAAGARWLMARIGQPGVLGEMLLGLLLGASFLGWAWPGASQALFPAEGRGLLEALGWVGLVLFMFSAGAELRWSRAGGRASAGVALGGLLVPLAAGLALALAAPQWFFGGAGDLRGVVLVALVMAVSALPVLGRLLQDGGLLARPLGAVVMGAATVDDVVAWSLLALVVGAGSIGLTGDLGVNLVLVGGLLALAVAVDRALPRLLRGRAQPTPATMFALLLALVLGSAMLTHQAGLHAVIGPFALGAIVARHPELRAYAAPRIDGLTMALFMPAFFVVAGLGTDLTLLGVHGGWLALGAVVLAASFSKLAGAYLGGRAIGMPREEAAAAGILLNARGAVGLVVAKVGLDQGLLAPHGFALLVAVIVLTTCLAAPALRLYQRLAARRLLEPEAALRAALRAEKGPVPEPALEVPARAPTLPLRPRR